MTTAEEQEGTAPFLWSPDWLSDPKFRAQMDRLEVKGKRIEKMTAWMKRIPVVGPFTYTFWYWLIDEGVKNTCKPRWGAMTFTYLNDGKPTLWHTVQSVIRKKDMGIWGGFRAPTSAEQATRWETGFALKHIANGNYDADYTNKLIQDQVDILLRDCPGYRKES